MARVRIALTLSGAVSLGAYEGGALAALLIAIEEIRRCDEDAVVIDAIAGASAGSMTGVLAARALLTQDDPYELMRRAWVDTPSLKNLRSRRGDAPLSIEKVWAEAIALLTGRCKRDFASAPPPQATPVRLRFALGALRGLDYSFRRGNRPPLDAASYLDWFDVTLGPRSTNGEFEQALEPAMASGAHAAAFPARKLNREPERESYEENGVSNFPDSGWLWYTDGGTVDNQPLGRALDLTAELDEDVGGEGRLHLLVIPDPNFPVPSSRPGWADPAHPPDWIETLAHAAKMSAAQSLYADFRTAEKVNARLDWSEELVDLLAPQVTSSKCEELVILIERIERIRAEDLGANRSDPPPPPRAEEGTKALLSRAIHAATGLHGKDPVTIDAISPRLIGAKSKDELAKRLSGEFLGHFGGFLSLEARKSDFALGYVSALSWMEDPDRGLQFSGVNADHVQAALAVVRERRPDSPKGAGVLTLRKLGPRVWMQLTGVAWRATRLAASEIRASIGRRRN